MNKIILIAFSLFIFSCGKKTPTNCDNDNCLGKHVYSLSNGDKSYVAVKDTTYVFVNSVNDTIRLVKRLTYTNNAIDKESCFCNEKSTDITSEYLHGVYILQNKNVALDYGICTTYPDKGNFVIWCADTNYIIHKTGGAPGASQFIIDNVHSKTNDMDSVNINGKYYKNIFSTFDHISSFPNPQITDIYYSKGFGIVRFKYNNFIYQIL
jgi:hypothetical protein